MIQAPRCEHIGGLDGLRGLAALAVFAVHFNQIVEFDAQIGRFDLYRLLANGEYGVALFFVLSGLLLGMPFWRAIVSRAKWPSIKVYTLRRLARILPAYYLALTALVLLTGLWRHPQAWVDIALHYSFLFNYAEFSIFSINPPFWTLAVEIQFYLLLPVIFVLLRGVAPRWILAGLVLLAVAAYGIHYWLVGAVTRTVPWPGSPWLTWIRPYGAVVTRSLLAHLPHFLIGVMAGWGLIHLQQWEAATAAKRTLWSEAVFWLCLLVILVLLGTEAGDAVSIPHGRYGLPLVPLLLAALALTAPFTRIAGGLLDSRIIRGLGILSYGIYIYHLPCLNLVDQTMARMGFDARTHWLALGAAALMLTLAVAAASYRLLERPVLNAVHRKSGIDRRIP